MAFFNMKQKYDTQKVNVQEEHVRVIIDMYRDCITSVVRLVTEETKTKVGLFQSSAFSLYRFVINPRCHHRGDLGGHVFGNAVCHLY